MRSLSKRQIDELAALELRVEELKDELKTAETIYKKALAPVLKYVDDKAEPDQAMNLTGVTAMIAFGRQRVTRKLLDPVAALLKLEKRRRGLGYESISIPIATLDKWLDPDETEGMYGVEYGARSVKVVKLSETGK